MQEIAFLVQGSAPNPYTVLFVKRSELKLSAYCTCQAGENGMYCKHRFNILHGITKGIVSDNLEDVMTVESWMPGSNIEKSLLNMQRLEKKALGVKKELSVAKKEVARAMLD